VEQKDKALVFFRKQAGRLGSRWSGARLAKDK